MRILQINTVFETGSTGRIMADISTTLKHNNYESFIAYGYSYDKKNKSDSAYCIESIPHLKFSILLSRVFGKHGFYNKSVTKKLIKWIDAVKPDVIHLHNIHGHYINIDLLFTYLKKLNKPVIWTLHDCWSFTGYCAYFDMVGCEKWKTGCGDCKGLKNYPFTWFFDRTKKSYTDKKKLFTSLDKMVVVTPSQWLADLAGQTFLNKYPIKVINNGIDLDVFKPKDSDFREKYQLADKNIVLALANGFEKRKGIDYILELAKRLENNYKIVLVGLEKQQMNLVPQSCIGILKTSNTTELAEIYSVANIFINPTLEDNFPTTNIEALACGTPIITFNTGGSPESVDETVGAVVEKGNLNELKAAILRICEVDKGFYSCNCRKKALEKYSKDNRYNDYIGLYQKLKNSNNIDEF
jgi:putative colanic acid biosynthesis glycosyltransferase